jgi:hypothetical protein
MTQFRTFSISEPYPTDALSFGLHRGMVYLQQDQSHRGLARHENVEHDFPEIFLGAIAQKPPPSYKK